MLQRFRGGARTEENLDFEEAREFGWHLYFLRSHCLEYNQNTSVFRGSLSSGSLPWCAPTSHRRSSPGLHPRESTGAEA